MINRISSLTRRSRPRAPAALDSTTLRFLVTGCSAAALFFALSVVMVKAGLSPFAGTLCAYAVAFVAAYTTQRAWTFRGQHRHRDALPRYLATQVGCAVLSAGLARLLAEAGGLPPVPRSRPSCPAGRATCCRATGCFLGCAACRCPMARPEPKWGGW
jgi:hypothetical protein